LTETEDGEYDTIDASSIEMTDTERASFKSLSSRRAAVHERIATNPSLREYWFRVIYSTQPFPVELVEIVNEYNRVHENTPVILIQGCNELFGSTGYTYLTQHEIRTAPSAPNLFHLACCPTPLQLRFMCWQSSEENKVKAPNNYYPSCLSIPCLTVGLPHSI
jgi:hypothetical protein